MSYDYIRRNSSGNIEIIRSHSFHGHHGRHHHHRHHVCRCFDGCAGVSLADYNKVCEQNSSLVEANARLARERDTLKTELCTLRVTNHDLYEANARLSHENDHLRHENAELRRSVSVEDGHNESFKRRIKALLKDLERKDAEIQDKDSIIRSLRLKIDELNNVVTQWKQSLTDSEKRREHLRRLLRVRDDDVRQRDLVIAEQDDNIRRLQALLRGYRHW